MGKYLISHEALLTAMYENPAVGGNERAAQLLEIIMKAPEVSDEELKVEAERRGYRMQKKPETVKFLPCVCGSKRRIRWFQYVDQTGYRYQCEKCGLKSELGKTQKLAKANWNAMIEEKMKDATD